MAIASKFLPRVKTKIISVEKLLEGSVAAEKKKTDDAKRQASEDRKAEKEKDLEKKTKKKDNPLTNVRKKTGNFIENFFVNMLMGFVSIKFLEFTKDKNFEGILAGIGGAIDFLYNTGGMILNGLVSFIEWGYSLYDSFRGWVENNFGEEGVKKFDTLMENLNTFLNAGLIAVLAFKKFKFLGKGLKNIGRFFGKIFKRGILRAFKRFSLKFLGRGVTNAIGKGLQAGKGLLGKGLQAGKGLLGKAFGAGSKFATSGVGNFIAKRAFDAKLAAKPILKKIGGFAGKFLGKAANFIAPAIKRGLPLAKGFLKRIPIFGSLIVALMSLLSGEPVGQALFKGIGAALGGALGSFIPIPVLGTLLGEVVGTFVGDVLYYGIVEGNWKKAGKVFGQGLKAALSAGKAVLQFLGDAGKRFIDDFPMVDVPDFKLGSLIGDLLVKANPVLDKLINFEFKIPEGGGRHSAINLLPIPDEWKTAMKEGFSVRGILDGLPGLREVLGAFAQFIPGLNKHVKDGALMKIPNLLLFTLPGFPFLIPHIGKSLLPGLFGEKPKKPGTDAAKPSEDSGGGFMDFLTGGASTGGEQQQPGSSGYSGSGLGSGGARMGNFDVEKSNDIVNIGKDLISKGFSVAEHPDFTKTPTPSGGTYTPGEGTVSDVHSGRGHYERRAIDVTDWRGSLEDSKARYRSVLDSVYNNGDMGKKLLIHDSWGIADETGKDGPGSHGHPTHMHIEVKDKGGLIGKGLFANLGKSEFVIDSDSLIPETMDMFRAITHAKDKQGVLAAIRDYAPYDAFAGEEILIPVPTPGASTESSSEEGVASIPQMVSAGEDPFERLYMQG
tara:strand:+ start:245 stop:2743 length:2499 start_codon:yes stop_codon:yes gene_type:complete